MKKKLVIHPGFHKSGTTALQEALSEHRKELKANGVLYPSIGTKTHHRAAWSLNGTVWGWKKRGGEQVSTKIWENLVRRINSSSDETVILSSEFFSELDGEKIRKIGHDFKNRELEIIFTLRPLAKLLPSSYQQYLKYGMKIKYDDWLHEIFNNREKTKVSPTFWMRHEHSKVIARWVDTFGSRKVTVLIADESRPSFLFEEVNDFLGLPKGTLVAAKRGSNRSLSMEEISLLLELNNQFPKERSWDEYEVFIRDGYIRELTDHVSPANDNERLLTPQWAIDRANEMGSETLKDLRNYGIRVIGNLESLGNSTVPMGQSMYPERIDIKTAASAMLAFDEKRVNKFPVKWLLKSLRIRVRKQI
ncbi:MAG: hypothetical protein EBY01_04795, partial [Actinobacteria bacterium]|nr:hypothetical protein [Actinomycetota bacterium]